MGRNSCQPWFTSCVRQAVRLPSRTCTALGLSYWTSSQARKWWRVAMWDEHFGILVPVLLNDENCDENCDDDEYDDEYDELWWWKSWDFSMFWLVTERLMARVNFSCHCFWMFHRQEKCAAQRTTTTEQSGGTRRSLFIALGHRTLAEPHGNFGVSWNGGGGSEQFLCYWPNLEWGNQWEKSEKEWTTYFRKHWYDFICPCTFASRAFSARNSFLTNEYGPLSMGCSNCFWPPGATVHTVLQCPQRSCIELCARI